MRCSFLFVLTNRIGLIDFAMLLCEWNHRTKSAEIQITIARLRLLHHRQLNHNATLRLLISEVWFASRNKRSTHAKWNHQSQLIDAESFKGERIFRYIYVEWAVNFNKKNFWLMPIQTSMRLARSLSVSSSRLRDISKLIIACTSTRLQLDELQFSNNTSLASKNNSKKSVA